MLGVHRLHRLVHLRDRRQSRVRRELRSTRRPSPAPEPTSARWRGWWSFRRRRRQPRRRRLGRRFQWRQPERRWLGWRFQRWQPEWRRLGWRFQRRQWKCRRLDQRRRQRRRRELRRGRDRQGGSTCVYPSGPYGTSVGKVLDPKLSWQGFVDGSTYGVDDLNHGLLRLRRQHAASTRCSWSNPRSGAAPARPRRRH